MENNTGIQDEWLLCTIACMSRQYWVDPSSLSASPSELVYLQQSSSKVPHSCTDKITSKGDV